MKAQGGLFARLACLWAKPASHPDREQLLHERRLRLIRDLPLDAPRIEVVPKRLAYILQASLPYVKSGYATRAQGLARGLVNSGMEVICLTRPGFPRIVEALEVADAPEADEIDGIKYLRLAAAGGVNQPDYHERAADIIEAALRQQKPEMVMAASPWWNALPALVAARRLGLPFFYEVRGFWEVTRASLEPAWKGSPTWHYRRELEAEVANAADHVFTLTGAMREELAARGVKPEQVTLLPNACDIKQFFPSPPDPALREELGLPDGVPVIGYIGSFEAYEELDDLIRAAAMIRSRGMDFRLLMVGAENPMAANAGALTALLHRVIEETGMADCIIRPGRIAHEDVRRHYDLLDIVAMPRKPMPVTEMVSPLKPLEAMAMQKPVLVSDVSALAEMIEDGITGLVFKKGDVTDMAAQLVRLVEDPALRTTLGQNARAHVLDKRTWGAVAKIAVAVIGK